MYGRKKILFVGTDQKMLVCLSRDYDTEVISSVRILDSILFNFIPDMLVFDSLEDLDVKAVRRYEKLRNVPIMVISDSFNGFGNESLVADFPRTILCNTAIALGKPFLQRIRCILEKKDAILPPRTGKLVKRAVFFINKNFGQQISREDISAYCGVSPDYLTRVFEKEMGILLWSYLAEFRLYMAKLMMEETSLTAKEVALKCGFANDSYFSKAFHKAYGVTPNSLRK